MFSARRRLLLPGLPTAREKGIDVTVDQLGFVVTAKGTPAPVLERLRSALNESTHTPEYADFLTESLIERAEPGEQELRDKVWDDARKYRTVAAHFGIKPAQGAASRGQFRRMACIGYSRVALWVTGE